MNGTHGATMGGAVIAEAVRRANVDPGEVEDVFMGTACQEAATGSNIARQSAIRAGLPVHVSRATVDRKCASGLQAIVMAAPATRYGGREVAGSSRPWAPHLSPNYSTTPTPSPS